MPLNQIKKLTILVLLVGSLLPIILFTLRKKETKMVSPKPVSVRGPAVAGAFYPRKKEDLSGQIEDFFRKALAKEGRPRILIVPHAGYVYSGQTAVVGFKQLAGQDYSTVILLGSSHGAWFSGGVIDENQAWETPLGKVMVDQELAQKLIKACPGLSFSSSAHAEEHSLEVELPFLQTALADFDLLPILLGETDEGFLESLAAALAENLSEETIVIISTDLSHYPPQPIAEEVDRLVIDAILSGDPQALTATITAEMKKGHSNLATCACGERAVKIGMILAQKWAPGEWQLLEYTNSGQVMGESGRVVGYASLAWYPKGPAQAAAGELNKAQQKQLLEIARKTLESHLAKKQIPEFKLTDPQLLVPQGAFVTLNKDDQLRGCIGEFETKQPLWQLIQQMAISAATNDPRFRPVRINELEEIEIEISVLSPLKKIEDPDEIKLGKHGVMIKKGFKKGVFLPQVATDTGWNKETFMGQLCSQKAGLSPDCWQKGEVEIYIFSAQVFAESDS